MVLQSLSGTETKPKFEMLYEKINLSVICPKYSDKHTWAFKVDPDQTAPKEQFDQGLLWMPFIQHFLDISPDSQRDVFKFYVKYGKKL